MVKTDGQPANHGPNLTPEPDLSNLDAATTSKPGLVELKNGKITFKQKPWSLEAMSGTLQEVVAFREMLETRIDQQETPLDPIPDQHKPVIAKLAHESDKTLGMLVKHIHRQLLPPEDEDDEAASSAAAAMLPVGVLEAAVKSAMSRNNYGLQQVEGGPKLPAGLCLWRWEVKEEHSDWLPANARDKAATRLAERVQAKQDLADMLAALSQDKRDAILDPKGAGKSNGKAAAKVVSTVNDTADADDTVDLTGDTPKASGSKKKGERKAETEGQGEGSSAPKAGSSKARKEKEVDPEKEAKEKEKQGKKAAKAEKIQKAEEAKNKSRSLMANFFGKPKPTVVKDRTSASPARELSAGPSSAASTMSEFARTFKPFVVKRGVEVAPVNWFHGPKGTHNSDIIVIDEDDDEVKAEPLQEAMEVDETSTIDVTGLEPKAHLQHLITTLPPPATRHPPRQPPAPPLKTSSSLAVRDIVAQLTEAEVGGDIAAVRSILAKLQDRKIFPAKVLIFAGDARPGYLGTWTRNSSFIGPRTPFGRDLVAMDYAYDSGEEWEQEPVGDADDVGDDVDDDEDPDEVDSDADSWMVDDSRQGTPVSEREGSPLLSNTQLSKRKADDGEKKMGKRRKVVVPLQPFAKGPCYESTIGELPYEPFNPYRIQLFNDTPFPINPFTFIAALPPTKKAANANSTFVVPDLPERLRADVPPVASGSALPVPVPGTPAAPAVKRVSVAPKTSFPDVHVPLLITTITMLATTSFQAIVDSLWGQLKAHNVKKNAIEAKIRSTAHKEKSVWVVKPNVLSDHLAATPVAVGNSIPSMSA